MTHYGKLSLLALTLAAATVAYAGKGTDNDALAIVNAKMPLVQAVAMAEQHVNGKASRAEYEKSKQGWIYEVEVVSGGKVFDVKVDAEKGTIISSVEDTEDDDHDKKD